MIRNGDGAVKRSKQLELPFECAQSAKMADVLSPPVSLQTHRIEKHVREAYNTLVTRGFATSSRRKA